MAWCLALVGRVALGFLLATAGAAERHFTVTMPMDWRTAPQVLLVLKDVELPRNVPMKLRAYAVDRSSRRLLGTYGVVAEDPRAEGTVRRDQVRIVVTRSLQRWTDAPRAGEKIEIVVEPVDAKGRLLETVNWTARDAALQVR